MTPLGRAARLGAPVVGQPPDRGRAAQGPAPRSGAAPGPTAGSLLPPATRLPILGVSEVTRAVRDAIRGDDRAARRVGRGRGRPGHDLERRPRLLHLKDERSQLSCIWFRDDRLSSPFEAQDGLRIVAHGRLDVFEPQGAYQLYVERHPAGGLRRPRDRVRGAQGAAVGRGPVRSRAQAPVPARPADIAVVTSSTGAVLHDIRRVLARRWPMARLVLSPCQVQGDGRRRERSSRRCAGSIERRPTERPACHGRAASRSSPAAVARSRTCGRSTRRSWSGRSSRIGRPVVAGVGHETDVTLAEFAADVRAPTPSVAAELVVPDRADDRRARRAARPARGHGRRRARIGALEQMLLQERRALDPAPPGRAARGRAGTRGTAPRPGHGDRRRAPSTGGPLAWTGWAAGRRSSWAPRSTPAPRASAGPGRRSRRLGPQATLERGYAIVRRRSDDARSCATPPMRPPGPASAIRLAHGDLGATVDPDGS